MKSKVTFKNRPKETGLAAIGAETYSDIKLNGKIVGWISNGHYLRVPRTFQVYLHVCRDDGSGWDNRKLKSDFETLQEAKDFVKGNLQTIIDTNKLVLHTVERD